MIEPTGYSNNLDQYVDVARNIFNSHKNLLKWNDEPESIMDLGIGDGKVTSEVFLPNIPQNIKEYIGCDMSKDMLESSKKVIVHPKFQTFQMNATVANVPVEMRERFHHILSNYLFHHVQNTRQAFVNIYSMLRPKGQLFFNAFAKIPHDEVFEILDQGKWRKYNNCKFHSPFYSHNDPRQAYEDLVKELGFVDCQLFKESVLTYHTEESLNNLYTALNTRLPFIDEQDKTEFNKDFVEACKKTSFIKYVSTDGNGNRILSIKCEVVTGVISKPL